MKVAFATCSGLWKRKVLPFGLAFSPTTFEKLMEQVLRGLHRILLLYVVLLYVDDIIMYSPVHLLNLTQASSKCVPAVPPGQP